MHCNATISMCDRPSGLSFRSPGRTITSPEARAPGRASRPPFTLFCRATAQTLPTDSSVRRAGPANLGAARRPSRPHHPRLSPVEANLTDEKEAESSSRQLGARGGLPPRHASPPFAPSVARRGKPYRSFLRPLPTRSGGNGPSLASSPTDGSGCWLMVGEFQHERAGEQVLLGAFDGPGPAQLTSSSDSAFDRFAHTGTPTNLSPCGLRRHCHRARQRSSCFSSRWASTVHESACPASHARLSSESVRETYSSPSLPDAHATAYA